MTAYELSELTAFRKQMEETEKAPLADRRRGEYFWIRALYDDHMGIAQQVGWLLSGSYGEGSHLSACRVLRSPKMNHVAWCALTIANLEYGCPAKFAIQAWKKLPVEKRYLVNEAIRQEIADAKREGYCGEIKKNPGKYKLIKIKDYGPDASVLYKYRGYVIEMSRRASGKHEYIVYWSMLAYDEDTGDRRKSSGTFYSLWEAKQFIDRIRESRK